MELKGNPFEHYILDSAQGERCQMCCNPATHKIGEEVPDDHPANRRHNWTNYLCCPCFGNVLGPAVVKWCKSNKE